MATALLWAEPLAQPVLSDFPSKWKVRKKPKYILLFGTDHKAGKNISRASLYHVEKIPCGLAMMFRRKLSGDPRRPPAGGFL